jgi:hypothetical protein
MQRKLGLGAVLMAVALAVLAFGSPLASGTENGREGTQEYTAAETQSTFLDLGEKGLSIGDELVFSDDVSRDDEAVGRDGGKCIVTHVKDAEKGAIDLLCIATLWIDDEGQITAQGLIGIESDDDRGPWTLAITGGTGDFRGASGEFVVEETSDTESTYTVDLD